MVDDCGVCGGVNACPVSDVLVVSSDAIAAILCTGPGNTTTDNTTTIELVSQRLRAALALALWVDVDSVVINALSCKASGSGRRALVGNGGNSALTTAGHDWSGAPQLLSPSSSSSHADHPRFLATAPVPGSRHVSISYTLSAPNTETAVVSATLADRLPAVTTSTPYNHNDDYKLSVISSEPVRLGTCGNGVCEVGESPSSCSSDCGVAPLACPTSTQPDASGSYQPCAGHGSCSLATGTCVCHAGWGGDACDACSVGYTSRSLSTISNGLTVLSLACLPLTDGSVLQSIIANNSAVAANLSNLLVSNGFASGSNSIAKGGSSLDSLPFVNTGGFTGLIAALASVFVAIGSVYVTLKVVRTKGQKDERATHQAKMLHMQDHPQLQQQQQGSDGSFRTTNVLQQARGDQRSGNGMGVMRRSFNWARNKLTGGAGNGNPFTSFDGVVRSPAQQSNEATIINGTAAAGSATNGSVAGASDAILLQNGVHSSSRRPSAVASHAGSASSASAAASGTGSGSGSIRAAGMPSNTVNSAVAAARASRNPASEAERGGDSRGSSNTENENEDSISPRVDTTKAAAGNSNNGGVIGKGGPAGAAPGGRRSTNGC